MATREENLKKINEELEKLSDEELDKVAGGSWIECSWKAYDKEFSSQQNQNNDAINQ